MNATRDTKIVSYPVEVYKDVKCDNCETELELVHKYNDTKVEPLNTQFKDTLEIRFVGGYGMYVDPYKEHHCDLKYLLCEKCADKLLEQFPCFKKISSV